MKLLWFLLFISLNAWSVDRLQLVFDETEIKQGALVKARLMVPPDAINFPVQKLKGENVSESIYFQQLSPLLRKDGSSAYESEVIVMFTNVPQGNSITGKINNQDIQIDWNEVKIQPVETNGQMLWSDFTAPDFFEKNWLKLLWVILIVPVVLLGVFGWRKYQAKIKAKKHRQQLIEEYRSCRSYDDVVAFWKKKRDYLKVFPQLEAAFTLFETTFFKYSFKPQQSETEKEEILKAYRKLLEDSEGGLRGV